ncbi:hypothetical protein [Gelidibacter japonicus]|uniref:hypothetical protein n=1 Tax=Gelidibacter japonicus TaxID=1962232 RepID=UPI002AFED4AB|nr:hypothetical protein [Gelidibacter japonicus]
MIDPRNLKKELDILNSEGTILGLYNDPKNNLFLGAFLKDGTGTVYFSVDIDSLKNYLQSKINLFDLYKTSDSFLIKHKFKKEVKTYLKEDFLDSLQCGTDFYKDIPESMKSVEFERKYGR